MRLVLQLQVSGGTIFTRNLAVVTQRALTGRLGVLLTLRGHEHGELLLGSPRAILAGRALPPVSDAALRGDLVGTQALLGQQAVAERVREAADVPGSHEHRIVREDGAVHTHDIGPLLHVDAPPVILEVALQLRTEGTVIPATVQAAVDFRRLKDETLALAKADDFLHFFRIRLCTICHNALIVPN